MKLKIKFENLTISVPEQIIIERRLIAYNLRHKNCCTKKLSLLIFVVEEISLLIITKVRKQTLLDSTCK